MTSAINAPLHPITEALADALRFSWGAASRSPAPFSSWLHVSVETCALTSALITLSARELIGVSIFDDDYAEIQDDIHTLYCVALERARGGAA